MKAKDYLKRIRKYDVMIKSREREKKQLENEETYISAVRYNGDRVQTSGSGRTGFPQSERIADLENQIRKLKALRKKIIDQLEGLSNPVYIELLQLKYIHGDEFGVIACEMGYSYDRIIHIHGEALLAFTRKYLNQ